MVVPSVEQRGVDVQVLHGHLHAPVGVARRRHGAGRAAAEEAQVGALVRGHGGQRAADGLGAHGSGHRGSGPRCPLAAPRSRTGPAARRASCRGRVLGRQVSRPRAAHKPPLLRSRAHSAAAAGKGFFLLPPCAPPPSSRQAPPIAPPPPSNSRSPPPALPRAPTPSAGLSRALLPGEPRLEAAVMEIPAGRRREPGVHSVRSRRSEDALLVACGYLGPLGPAAVSSATLPEENGRTGSSPRTCFPAHPPAVTRTGAPEGASRSPGISALPNYIS
ncbi:uncharacterized protein RBU33_003098 isoform 1-T1 [Hipposideros larvatus]